MNTKIKIVIGSIDEETKVGRILTIINQIDERVLDFVGFADERQQLVDAIENVTPLKSTHFSIADLGFWCNLTFVKLRGNDKLYCRGTILKHHHAMKDHKYYKDTPAGFEGNLNAFRMISLSRMEQSEEVGNLLEVEVSYDE